MDDPSGLGGHWPSSRVSIIAWRYARRWCVAMLLCTVAAVAAVIVDSAMETRLIPPPLWLAGVLVVAAWPIVFLGLLVRVRSLLRRTTKRSCLRCSYPLAKGRSGCSECGEDFWWERDRPPTG